MSIPASFLSLTNHPAAGLHFPRHGKGAYEKFVVPSPHRFGHPADIQQIELLRRRTNAYPSLQGDLMDFYTRWNGVDLCCLPDPLSGVPKAALSILPVHEWETFTDEIITGDLNWMLEGLEDMYVPNTFFVIAVSPEEDTRLVLFTDGISDGQPLAGKIFYLSMDPVLETTEPIANDFPEWLDQFATDPAAFLRRIGYVHTSMGKSGLFGTVADEYLADCGLHLDESESTLDVEKSADIDGPMLFD